MGSATSSRVRDWRVPVAGCTDRDWSAGWVRSTDRVRAGASAYGQCPWSVVRPYASVLSRVRGEALAYDPFP